MNLFDLVNAFEWNEVKRVTVLDKDDHTIQSFEDKNELDPKLFTSKVMIVSFIPENKRVVSLNVKVGGTV